MIGGGWWLACVMEWAFAIALAASVIGLIVVGAWSCWRDADRREKKREQKRRETAVYDGRARRFLDAVDGPEGKQWTQWLW